MKRWFNIETPSVFYLCQLSFIFNNCNVQLYADDIVIYVTNSDILLIQLSLQFDFKYLQDWLLDNVGKRAFVFKDSIDWNNLPADIRTIASFKMFKQTLLYFILVCRLSLKMLLFLYIYFFVYI